MAKALEEMSKEELERELKKLLGDLEDLDDTFNFNLAHTSAHLSSALVSEHEEELEEMKERVARVEGLLRKHV